MKKLLILFCNTFMLSAFTFGGGYVIVPMMKKRFVDKLNWISEDEMLDYVAMAQSSPGPIAINACILIGRKVAGFPGMIFAIFGTILPPFVLLSFLSVWYDKFSGNTIVKSMLHGMQAGTLAVIIDVVWDMCYSIIKMKKILPVFLTVLSFISVTVFHIDAAIVLIVCGIFGFLIFGGKKCN